MIRVQFNKPTACTVLVSSTGLYGSFRSCGFLAYDNCHHRGGEHMHSTRNGEIRLRSFVPCAPVDHHGERAGPLALRPLPLCWPSNSAEMRRHTASNVKKEAIMNRGRSEPNPAGCGKRSRLMAVTRVALYLCVQTSAASWYEMNRNAMCMRRRARCVTHHHDACR